MECLLIPFLIIAFNLKFASTQTVPSDISGIEMADSAGSTSLGNCVLWVSPFGVEKRGEIEGNKDNAHIWTCKADPYKNVLLVPFAITEIGFGDMSQYTGDVLMIFKGSICHNGYYMIINNTISSADSMLKKASAEVNPERKSQFNFVPATDAWYHFDLNVTETLPLGRNELYFDLEVQTAGANGSKMAAYNWIKTVNNFKKPVLTVGKTNLSRDETTVCTAIAYPAVEGFKWECDSGNWIAKEASISMKDPGTHQCRCSAYNTINGENYTGTWSGTLEISEAEPQNETYDEDDEGNKTVESNGMGLHVQKIIIMLQVWSLLALLLPD